MGYGVRVFIGIAVVGMMVFYNNCTSSDDGGGSTQLLSQEFELPGCEPGEGATGSPETMEQVVDLINSLPKPVTIPCFMQALDRPLKINATSSEFSAQPSFSRRSPRIFIFINKIVLSVVPEGESGDLLEYSFLLSDRRSIKAELKFPVPEELPYSAPFDRIIDPESTDGNSATLCLACHGAEVPVADIDYARAFSSNAFKPVGQRVYLEQLQKEYQECLANSDDSDRCVFYKVMFNKEVEDTTFPEAMPTI